MNPEITIEIEPTLHTEVPSLPTPGKRLRKAREALRLSQADISRQLKLKPYFIEAIENDEYSKMPALTFVRGYLRIYARAVNLSGDEIIQAFNQLGLEEKQNHVSHQIFYKKQEAKQDSTLRWTTYAVVGILVILFLTWWFSEHAAAPQVVAQPSKPAIVVTTAPVVAPVSTEPAPPSVPVKPSSEPKETPPTPTVAHSEDNQSEDNSDTTTDEE